MALRMASPFEHPKTGVFWFRRGVPKDLQALLGKKEELLSLRTKDPAEARVRFAEVSAKVEARWASLRLGPSSLTEREAHELAVAIHDRWLTHHLDNPSEPSGWRADLFDQLWVEPAHWDLNRPMADRIQDLAVSVSSPARAQEEWCLGQADERLADLGRVVDAASRLKLAKAVAAAVQRASQTLSRAALGTYPGLHSPTASVVSAPPVGQPPVASGGTAREPQAKLALTELLSGWWAEAKATGRKVSTYDNYRNTINNFVSFLNFDDATKVSTDDVIAFKDFRLSTPSERTNRVPSAKTVKDTDLAALKTIFGWAVVNRKLAANPAASVTVRVGKAPKLRSKGFTEGEAKKLLFAAFAYTPGAERACTAAAKRWVPWLCAFTGARVGEIGQLRKQDVRREGDWWVIRITPEAGTVKTDEAREIVIHPQVVKLGFPEFVSQSAEGPLFLLPGKQGDVLGPLQGLKNRLAEFAREIVTDPNVAPNHGWRHRFKTIGIEAGIETRVLDAIQGHAGQSVSDRYGEVTLRARAAAIEKLPWVDQPD